jgi:hypothetical protein
LNSIAPRQSNSTIQIKPGKPNGPMAQKQQRNDSTVSDPKKWSAKVTRESNALSLEHGVFTWKDPKRIAESLKASAEASTRRKAEPFKSAMSMLIFYINRTGRNLDPEQKQILEQAKRALRELYGKK